MSERRPVGPWEQQLRTTAQALRYPPTPDIAPGVTARLRSDRRAPGTMQRRLTPRLRVALVVVALFVLSLLAVPDVRATLGSWLRIGAIEIVLPTPTPLIVPTEQPIMAPTALPRVATPVPAQQPQATPEPVRTATPVATPTATPLASLLDLTGETTLEQARERVRFPIKLPAYPDDLGPPDRVFLQDWDGDIVVLVWLQPGTSDRVRMSLHVMSFDAVGRKFADQFTLLEETAVHGERAVWVDGPHMLSVYTRRSGSSTSRLVTGNVLVWTDDGITYRLEIDSSLDEAVRIAESTQ